MEIHGTLTSKGQITLPKDIRIALGLQAGDIVAFTLDDHAQVSLRKMPAQPSLAGILRVYGKGKTLSEEAVRHAIARAVKP